MISKVFARIKAMTTQCNILIHLFLMAFTVITVKMYCTQLNESITLQLSSNLPKAGPPQLMAQTKIEDSLFPKVEDLTFEKFFKYIFWTNSSSCKLAVDFGFSLLANGNMIMGPDGFKSICMDPGIGPRFNNCLAYSFGVRDEWSFEEKMEQYGCNVYAFDPSMEKGDHQHSPRVWFYKMGLGGKDYDKHPKTSWKIRTLTSIHDMLKNVHDSEIIDVLKIDIEHSEWRTLPHIYRSGILDKVKQIAIDVHFDRSATFEEFKLYYRIIRALEEDHGFYRFSSRPSPWGNVYIESWGRNANYAFEMAWYNSKYRDQSANDPFIFW